MKFINKLFFFLLLFFSARCLSQNVTDSLWKAYTISNEPAEKYGVLFALGNHYGHVGDLGNKDSVADMIVDQTTFQRNDTMKVKALRLYFAYKITNLQQASEYGNELMNLAVQARNNEWIYAAYTARAKIELAKGSIDIACKNMEIAFQNISFTNNERLKAECMLLMGNCQEQNNQKLEAFDHYMRGMYMADMLEDDELLMRAYQYLASFYSYVRNGSKAEEYKLSQLKVLAGMKPFDSLEYMTQMADLADIYFDNNVPISGTQIIRQVLNYADLHHNTTMKDEALTIYRSYLIENNEMKLLAKLYQEQYPEALTQMAQRDTTMYLRLVAYIAEVNGNNDQALFYYNEVEKRLNARMEILQVSNFYKRFGQFLLRRREPVASIAKFDSSFAYAKRAGYLPFIAETAHYLDSLNYLTGNVDIAYHFAQISHIYSDSLRNIQKADELLLHELDYSAKQRELQQLRHEEETTRRHNLQYMGIVLCIVLSFIILIALGSFKVHRLLLRAMGFFSFIFFFEFIILLADNQIHEFTHGEPWKVILIKIVLIGFLLPLHHWLEEKVVHYLSNHKLIDTSKFSITRLRKRKAPQNEVVAKAEEQN